MSEDELDVLLLSLREEDDEESPLSAFFRVFLFVSFFSEVGFFVTFTSVVIIFVSPVAVLFDLVMSESTYSS